ncbi:hypothetical protein KK141_05785 [Dyella sp. LX-66]|uniref:hypothetical protein n=1 Tax=unclassified Dyella TaxID=2634549 RepID=UPI001BE12736|nr:MULTISPECIES: hypothetical protein [unclassified Dyella]MBT2116783.1 hypothetical protein [Dyella sp. LX-1]MBT2139037.1 hypothetical protein [Dyella sp. LX-66]
MKYQKVLNRAMFFVWLIVGAWMAFYQLMGGQHVPAFLVVGASVLLAIGHWKERRWAAQASTFLLLMFNVFAVFLCFPPFEAGGTTSFTTSMLRFAGISILCIGASIGLYLIQRRPGQRK